MHAVQSNYSDFHFTEKYLKMTHYTYTPQNYICFLYHLSIAEWWDAEMVEQVAFDFREKEDFRASKKSANHENATVRRSTTQTIEKHHYGRRSLGWFIYTTSVHL